METTSKKNKGFFQNMLSVLGPGIITAALIFGPSKMTITSKMGADFGFDLIWIIVIAIFFMSVYTNMSTRIGMATDDTLLTLIRKKYGRGVSILIGIGIFLVATCFQSGNATGIAVSISEPTHTSPEIWIILFNIVGISLLFFRSFYLIFEKLMLALIIIMLFAFLTTVIMMPPPLAALSKGFIPGLPEGSIGLIIAFTASCFSIVGAFYQSYLVQTRKKLSQNHTIKETVTGSQVGIILLGIMSAAVLICAANTLHPQHIKVNSASEMGKALEPLLGSSARALFLTGLFSASFSSLIGNAVLGGSLLGDTFRYGNNLNHKMVKLFISLVMIFGTVIAIVFGKLPLQLIVFAQSITIFLVPFIGITMFMIANDKEIMKEHVNKLSTRIWGITGLLILIGLAISNLLTLLK
ncbi:Nramp family divalent metal transporter [Arcticibacter tournemirensis]|uniref:Divalent metal cation transporter n=1 Tax=Arcticibacter tournemirensis TaxID=699437 RepID=A0A4Q0MBN0_9SPHI|nr:Nramp family divalent metal transporter [Arcticibacter tournemirensis]RXF70565.1 divalent metal cation transporter [Arcticibacter tournemirensis]